MAYLLNLKNVSYKDIDLVGGKNASLGEMIQCLAQQGIHVPGGFATSTLYFKKFLLDNHLDAKITKALGSININHVKTLEKTAKLIRSWIIAAPFDKEFQQEIIKMYAGFKNKPVAIRSSATTEDLQSASFAGQQESYLNVKGAANVLKSIKKVFASLFTARAIAYCHHQGFDLSETSISVGIQPMVRSDKGASGVIFTLDTESGFRDVILITSSYGLGESIVQGKVNPDEFCVSKTLLKKNTFPILQRQLGSKNVKMIFSDNSANVKIAKISDKDKYRFSLDDEEVLSLAKQALIIEQHYGKPMDIEWAKDGITGELFIVQARPETVKSQARQTKNIETYQLTTTGKILAQGQSVGQRIGQGAAKIILDPKKMHDFQKGQVLVTDMTDPDWEPIMKLASAIVTNRGGRTCHAAIIARELGIPALVGCKTATKSIKNHKPITVSCAEGQLGYVYEGKLPFQVNTFSVEKMPELPIKLCINLGNPDKAFSTQFLPNEGVGLARIEFIISNMIGIHPNALLNYSSLPKTLKHIIYQKTSAYKNPVEYYIEKLREGISVIAAAFYPKQVIFRFSDFKSNEYANLLGGNLYEAHEENPMIGFRGASRYIDKSFKNCFELECKALKRVRHEMGLDNAHVMVPFVRTVEELKNVITLMENFGLKRGKNNLKIYMMCEIPSNALLAAEFLEYVDGFSIGSNDLTQLTLGLDRDSNLVASLFDERNKAVKILLRLAIAECKKAKKYIGICGQGPSDHLDFAKWLMEEGIESISLNPDTVISTWLELGKKISAAAERLDASFYGIPASGINTSMP